MMSSVRGGQILRLGTPSVVSGAAAAPARHPASPATPEASGLERANVASLGGSTGARPGAQVSRRQEQELSKRQAATWIRALLRVQPELQLVWVAEELGVSDHAVGLGLGLLIREGKARIRDGPDGLRVIRVEREPSGGSRMPPEWRE